MKKIIVLLLMIKSFASIGQNKYSSSYYTENENVVKYPTTIFFDWDTKSIRHTNGFNISNYPLKLRDVKDDSEIKVIILEPDVNPDNYNSEVFKSYGFRGFQIYIGNGLDDFRGLVEIITYPNSQKVKIIKYKL
ncbi:hypothetical protein ACHRVK_21065 [Flavobacterium plurextorum]|uniref:hypothetical protein n=1 Tax=Flavobacterium plurextorum TaxID=1114867 RepID=UPI0037581B29